MENSIDKEYVKKMCEQVKGIKEYDDYTMAYVSASPTPNLPVAEIKCIAMSIKHNSSDSVVVQTLRHKGSQYSFVFIKNDEITEGNKDKHALLKQMALENSLLKSVLALGRTVYMMNGGSLPNEKKIANAELTMFIDEKGDVHDLYELPIALVDVKSDDVDKKLFLESFKKAKENCNEWCDLKRKYVVDEFGNERQYIYAMLNEKLYTQWTKRKQKTETYKKNIEMLVNNIRLDLDQAVNACKEYKIINANFDEGKSVTADNRAFIYEKNTQSVCLVGSTYFDKSFLEKCYYVVSNKAGNYYPIEKIMFMPKKGTIDAILSYLDKNNIENSINFTQEEIEALEQGVLDAGFEKGHDHSEEGVKKTLDYWQALGKAKGLLYDQKLREKLGETSDYIRKLDPAFDANNSFLELPKEFKYAHFVTYYSEMKTLREKMNYFDETQGRTLRMKNVFELGFSYAERQELVDAFGELGGKIYDRAFFIRFADYMLDTYKTSGAMYDLTAISSKFERSEIEMKNLSLLKDKLLLDNPEQAMRLIKKIDKLYGFASLDSYIKLLKRFNGIIDIKVKQESDNKEKGRGAKFEQPKEMDVTFDKGAYKEIEAKIGKLIEPWIFDASSQEPSVHLFAKTSINSRKATLEVFENTLRDKLEACEKRFEANVKNTDISVE